VLLLAGMVPVVAILSPLENRSLPWWDEPVARRSGPVRNAALLTALAGLGVAVLMLARGGLTGDGVWWLIMGLACATCSRCVAVPAGRPTAAPGLPGDDASLQVSAPR
jgi:hypothetical protein